LTNEQQQKCDYSGHPETVFFEPLYGCNLHCSYCYVGESKNHSSPTLPPYSVTENILSEIRRSGVDEIILLGGEPTLHPEFSAICWEIFNLEFAYRGVITNGTALTSSKVSVLEQTGFWVDISFRGHNSESFDAIAAKPGAYNKALQAALLLSRSNIPLGIEIDCTPLNYDHVLETVQILVEKGVIRFQDLLRRMNLEP